MRSKIPVLKPNEYKGEIRALINQGYNRIDGWDEFQKLKGSYRFTYTAFTRFWTEVVTEPMVKGIITKHRGIRQDKRPFFQAWDTPKCVVMPFLMWGATFWIAPLLLVGFFSYVIWEYRKEIKRFIVGDVPKDQQDCFMCDLGYCDEQNVNCNKKRMKRLRDQGRIK
jgi:hypothetical protein